MGPVVIFPSYKARSTKEPELTTLYPASIAYFIRHDSIRKAYCSIYLPGVQIRFSF